MSGTISLSSDARWSAASWLFDWVLRTLARNIKDAELSAFFTGLIGENIGWLSFDELTPHQQAEVRLAIRDSLIGTAEREFPEAMAGREGALGLLRDLANVVST
jgi:hypothetical protein